MRNEGADPVILVTGGTGLVGSRVAKRLAALGHLIRAIVRRVGESPELRAAGVVEIGGDFVDPTVAGPAARGADIVVHCAATSGPELDPVRRVNAEGTRTMVEAALAAGCRKFIHISTCSVYAVSGLELVDESAPLETAGDPYGRTKAEADRIVLDASGRGLSATILRPGCILGVHPTSTWAVKVPARIRDRQVKLMDSEAWFPFLHVENLVDAVLLSIEQERAAGRVYNMVDGHVPRRSYMEEVRAWFGTAPLEVVPRDMVPPGAAWNGKFDARRIPEELGYAPRRTYEQGMEEAAHFWRTQHESTRPV